MKESRRDFLKIAGCSTLGALCGVPLVRKFAKASESRTAKGLSHHWAMVIDVKRIAQDNVRHAARLACHLHHNVPDLGVEEEEIKWIWSVEYKNAFPTQVHPYTEDALRKSSVLVLCNHCERPPCVRVCPTQATFRRESDGIVMMDEHRCIGCRYCMAACPYGSRSFNWRNPRPFLTSTNPDFPTRCKGVVEKCNFCADLMGKHDGDLRTFRPLCVEAANKIAGPGAMAFGDLSDPNSEVARILRQKYTIQRKPGLGTGPQVYYVV